MKHSVITITILLVVAAAVYPNPGAKLYHYISFALIVILFLLQGITLDLRELKNASFAIKFHLSCQAFTMLLTPLFFYLTMYKWGLFHIILGSKALAVGTMIVLTLPTTTNTNVMFTQEAGGDVSATTINAAIGNLVGAPISPVVSSLALGTSVTSQSIETTLFAIMKQIVVPLCIGIILQLLVLKTKGDRFVSDFIRSKGRFLSKIILIIFLYLIFCDSFASDAGDGLNPQDLARLVVFCFAIHLLIILGAWLCADFCCGQNIQRKISFIMICPQKTEALGVTIVTSLFDDDDDIGPHTLPIVIYHCVQMLVAASLVSTLKRFVDARTFPKPLLEDNHNIVDELLLEEDPALPAERLTVPLLVDEDEQGN